MSSTDITAVTNEGALRVSSIFNDLAPWLSDRAIDVLATSRTETSAEMFAFGRVVGSADGRYEDFAKRLNQLCEALDGATEYIWKEGEKCTLVRPKVSSCISVPLSVPLIDGRFLFVVHVFVDGLPVTSWSTTELSPGNHEVRRVWINSIVGKFITANRDGELPENSEE